jgi:hypothetical protein
LKVWSSSDIIRDVYTTIGFIPQKLTKLLKTLMVV